MSDALEALKEQNRLIAEQNALLRKLAEQSAVKAQVEIGNDGRLMTDNDLQLILRSDNLYEAIDRWNTGCASKSKKGCEDNRKQES